MKKVLVLILFILSFLTSFGKTAIPDINSKTITMNDLDNYLKKSLSKENQENDINLSLLDDEIKGKDIFFTGELHGTESNKILEFKFLKYFKSKTDFKYHLCETAYSQAYFINKYIETGDVKFLNQVYENVKGTFAYSSSNIEYWKKFREYNETLPTNKKIRVIGVDIEHQPLISYAYMNEILPQNKAPKEIKGLINNLKQYYEEIKRTGKDNNYKNLKLAKEFKDSMEKNEAVYKNYLGNNYLGFKLVNQNILNRNEAYNYNGNSVTWNNTRDKMMYENFVSINKSLPSGKFFGQWGMNHIFQNKQGGVTWFASYLNSDTSKYKGKILSIAYQYENCGFMNQDNSGSKIMNYVGFNLPVITNQKSSHKIYRLTGKDSPFWYAPMFDTDGEKSFLEFFQYLVHIKGSKAVVSIQ